MLGGNAPVIRIVKKKSGHGGHHGGAWKVAYADFVTAMMAFFLVMWILGLSKPMRKAIESYFKNPSGFSKMGRGGKSPLSDGENIVAVAGQPALLSLTAPRGVEAQFKRVQDAILKAMEKSPDLKGLKDSVEVHLTDEGLRIELIEKSSSLFFDTGSAALKSRTYHLLQVIAGQLSKLDNPIVVEGHTDSQPLGRAGGYSNWELSTDRANSARRAMETYGLREGQVITVSGFADRKLLRPDDPTHFSNRRVSILVAYIKKGP